MLWCRYNSLGPDRKQSRWSCGQWKPQPSLLTHLNVTYRELQTQMTKNRLILHGGGGEREESGRGNGPCAYFISSLSLFHFVSINRQTLGSWGVVHAEQMHPLAVSLHSPHNEPDGMRAERRRHFHSSQGRGRGRMLPWRCGCWAEGPGRRRSWARKAETLRWADLSALISVSSCLPLLLILPPSSLPSSSLSFSTMRQGGDEEMSVESSVLRSTSGSLM